MEISARRLLHAAQLADSAKDGVPEATHDRIPGVLVGEGRGHLDNKFRVFRALSHVHPVNDEASYEEVTELIEVKQGDHLLLLPGQAVLGITVERITLPDNLCGWLEGRSRFARVGLMVHMTASFMQPGISNKQVLELNNVGPVPLAIYPGTAVCQFIFEECKGRARYRGRFANQVTP